MIKEHSKKIAADRSRSQKLETEERLKVLRKEGLRAWRAKEELNPDIVDLVVMHR